MPADPRFCALTIDYLRQLSELVDEAIEVYQARETEQSHAASCNTLEDLMVCHNRLARAIQRAGNDDDGKKKAA